MKDIYKNLYFLLHLFWIIILSLIPVYYTWGRLAIGGDVLIFFSSKGLGKYLYQWIPLYNGVSFPLNYYPLYFLYKIAENFKLDPYQTSALVLFVLSLLAGLGIYKLAKLIYGKDGLFMLVPITFYILSPMHLNGWHYIYIYSTAPWFIYFIFKILKSKEISVGNIIWLNVIIFFSSMDLPNPKYLFHLYIIMLTIIFSGILFRLINLQLIIRSWWKIIVFFLLSAYIYLPLGYFYTQLSAVIPVKSGYRIEGKMADYGNTTVDRMVLLHHKGVNLNSPEAMKYSSNPVITFLSYTFIFLIIINLIFRKKDDSMYKYDLIFFILILIFLFFAVGPNPPLGFIYEYIVSNFQAFAFLRTTAGAVFFISIFYAVVLGSFVNRINKFQKLFIISLILVTGIVNYPYINGEYFKNMNNVNEYTDRQEYGFKVPSIYFDLVDIIDNQRIDAKYVHTRNNLIYMGTRWGYFGPIIYFFLYDTANVPYDRIYSNLANHNIGYVFTDNSSVDTGKRFKYKIGKVIVDKSPIQIEEVAKDEFLPHFYTPQAVIVTEKNIDDLYQIIDKPDYKIRSAIYINNKDIKVQNPKLLEQMPKEIDNTPILEFKKINQTKYRLIVHQARSNFPLVFSESFHAGWKAYVTSSKLNPPAGGQNSKLNIDNYKILVGNEDDQANKEDLLGFMDKGWITTLGDGKEKNIGHKKYENGKEKLEYIEKYKIDFISKNFQDTIQNDNLLTGIFDETWLASNLAVINGPWYKRFLGFPRNDKVVQIPDENHQTVNVFANSWWIEVDKICKINNLCVKNKDGTYDFEMIVEFWPQQVFYIGVILSLSTLLITIICLTFVRYKGIVHNKL